jgi:bidirectional [NiFe] hydrogenase diaphorase subunit
MTVHTLKINGQEVAGNEGQTILDVARENGFFIPTMCFMTGLSATGQCRLCVVEVAGSNKLLPACTTSVVEGMDVTTDTPELAEHRKSITEMLFLERTHICSICVANNHCELQWMADKLRVDHFELPPVNPEVGIDASHPLFAIDHNRCIMCTRCVRVCAEIEGAHTWGVMGAGLAERVVTDMGTPWGESTTCTSCGKCVQVCPTGALFEKGRSVGEGSKTRRRFLPFVRAVASEEAPT